MQSSDGRLLFKILIVGDMSVGKTCLLTQFTKGKFLDSSEAQSTIGVDFSEHTMQLGDQTVKLTIWDTAGQERFRTLTASYYRGAQGVILAYDVTRPETFASLERWLSEVDIHSTSRNVVKMLVGNKIDMEDSRAVSREEGEAFARTHSMLFIEASAKTSEGVHDAFEELVQKIIDTPALYAPADSERLKVNSDNAEPEETYCACF